MSDGAGLPVLDCKRGYEEIFMGGKMPACGAQWPLVEHWLKRRLLSLWGGGKIFCMFLIDYRLKSYHWFYCFGHALFPIKKHRQIALIRLLLIWMEMVFLLRTTMPIKTAPNLENCHDGTDSECDGLIDEGVTCHFIRFGRWRFWRWGFIYRRLSSFGRLYSHLNGWQHGAFDQSCSWRKL